MTCWVRLTVRWSQSGLYSVDSVDVLRWSCPSSNSKDCNALRQIMSYVHVSFKRLKTYGPMDLSEGLDRKLLMLQAISNRRNSLFATLWTSGANRLYVNLQLDNVRKENFPSCFQLPIKLEKTFRFVFTRKWLRYVTYVRVFPIANPSVVCRS